MRKISDGLMGLSLQSLWPEPCLDLPLSDAHATQLDFTPGCNSYDYIP